MTALPGLIELSVEGLPGPTHMYRGMAPGDFASERSSGRISRPRAAALQAIAKMRTLLEEGVLVAIAPPHERPAIGLFRDLGFDGTPAQLLESVMAVSPRLLFAGLSSSPMWMANSATVFPSVDAGDGRAHVICANLGANLHRSIECAEHIAYFRRLFIDESRVCVHEPIPVSAQTTDEGAANHMRLSATTDSTGLHAFVYGLQTHLTDPEAVRASGARPVRQTLEASQAVCRLARLRAEACAFLQQAPESVEAGVFHNDVVATSAPGLLLVHERAFVSGASEVDRVKRHLGRLEIDCAVRTVAEEELSLSRAVGTYFFNGQLVSTSGGILALFPRECEADRASRRLIDTLVGQGLLEPSKVRFIDVSESMANGGGPACQRLRVPLTPEEITTVEERLVATPERLDALERLVERFYPEEIAGDARELTTTEFYDRCCRALDEISQVLGLARFYRFQKDRAGDGTSAEAAFARRSI